MRRAVPLSLTVSLLVSLTLSACGGGTPSLPQGLQTIQGIVRPAELSLTRRGTHTLEQDGKTLTYLESTVVNLRDLEGREADLRGVFEANSDPHALPVLVVQAVLRGGKEEKRAWSLPSLQATFSVPKSWDGVMTKTGVRFTQSGSVSPILVVGTESEASLPYTFRTLTSSSSTLTLHPLLVADRKAAVALDEQAGTMNISIEIDPANTKNPSVLTFAFRVTTDISQEQQVEDDMDIARSVQFGTASSQRSAGASSSSMSALPGIDGKPCGGSAGVLCPAGYSCQVTDAESDIGRCKKI